LRKEKKEERERDTEKRKDIYTFFRLRTSRFFCRFGERQYAQISRHDRDKYKKISTLSTWEARANDVCSKRSSDGCDIFDPTQSPRDDRNLLPSLRGRKLPLSTSNFAFQDQVVELRSKSVLFGILRHPLIYAETECRIFVS